MLQFVFQLCLQLHHVMLKVVNVLVLDFAFVCELNIGDESKHLPYLS